MAPTSLLAAVGALTSGALLKPCAATVPNSAIEVAAFVYDPWTPEPAVWGVHGANWTEWELVRRAEPRFPGHLQPHVPLWGEIDTSLPETWYMLNVHALAAGVSVYFWDWYWWQDAPSNPLLVRGLEEGFLHANNSDAVQFAVMWANQNWSDIMPSKRGVELPPTYHGVVDAATFAEITAYWISRYFPRPNYYRAPNATGARVCPLVNVYELDTLVAGLGGLDAAAAALGRFRADAAAAGFPCVHLQVEGFGLRSYGASMSQVIAQLGIGSVTDYCWQHYEGMGSFPLTDYADYSAKSIARYASLAAQAAPAKYVPNFSIAWDPSPRTVQSDFFAAGDYPWTSVLQPTPAQIQAALASAAAALTATCDPTWCMLTVYAYTEFSEGGSLFPTVADGYGRLDAFAAVLGSRRG